MAQGRVRTCVACGATDAKGALARVVRDAAGEVRVDPTGRAPGRGAYLCRRAECFAKARSRHALDRALRVRLDEADYARLEVEFGTLCAEHSDAQ